MLGTEAEVRRQVLPTPHLRTHLTNRKWKPIESDVQRCYNSDKRFDKRLA